MVGGQVADPKLKEKSVGPECSNIFTVPRPRFDNGLDYFGPRCAQALRMTMLHVCAVSEKRSAGFKSPTTFLDVEESSAALEKPPAKTSLNKKATYPSVFGLERSHQSPETFRKSDRRIDTLRRQSIAAGEIASSSSTAVLNCFHEAKSQKKRLDLLVVERGLAESRQKSPSHDPRRRSESTGVKAEKAGGSKVADSARLDVTSALQK